jgi:RimJ/RimL family protein N-acetyltransferase
LRSLLPRSAARGGLTATVAVNTRAIALYRDFGFVEEGRLRRRVRTADGEFLDDVAMAWIPDSARSR